MPIVNSNTDKFVIKTPRSMAERPQTLEGWQKIFTAAEQCEIFNRYCDVKDREAKYRRAAAAKNKAIKAYLEAEGVDVDALVAGEREA